MESIFVDVNVMVDILGDRKYGYEEMLDGKVITLSALSFHILMYLRKMKVPSVMMDKYRKTGVIVAMTNKIVKRALVGPTSDFEDNVQLHSAARASCDVFLTMDKRLLKMRYFGKMRICDKL